MNTLSIAGRQLEDVYVDASLSFNKPKKDTETIKVPGRNGALVIDYGVWDNVMITYPCYTKSMVAFDKIINLLGSLKGYQYIECSADATHYRKGVPIIPQAPTVKRINSNVYFGLSFNCKPQRFLTAGDEETLYTSTGTKHMTNPTNFDSRPMLRIAGNGTVQIGNISIETANNSGSGRYIDIDCDLMTCTEGSVDRNADVSFSPNDFPTLVPGNNTIVIGSGISAVRVIPKWWEL